MQCSFIPALGVLFEMNQWHEATAWYSLAGNTR